MIAITKRQKREAKRGRPKLPAIDREPNGRQSRRKESQQVQAQAELADTPAIQRRIRESNIVEFKQKDGKVISPERQALDPRRGYALGLLLLDHRITEAQHDAGLRYAEDLSRWLGLVVGSFPSVRAQNLFAVRGMSGESEPRAAQAKRARATMVSLREALLSVGDIDTGRKVEHAVRNVCLLDIPQARAWPEPMMLLLRKGLNTLAKFYHLS